MTNTELAILTSNLTQRGFLVHFADSKNDIIKYTLNLIKPEESIGFGGSMTVEELDLPKILFDRGNTTLHYKVNTDYDYRALNKMASSCDWLLTSSNAITLDGQLVNIDGNSNRVANMIYGPQNVLLIISMSKVCANINDAILRIRNYVAPLNAKRLNRNTPCATTGKCSDCNCDDNICRSTVIIHHPSNNNKKFHILLTSEKLGF